MEKAESIWMNGEFVARDHAKVHVLSHGLHYGTGVFEASAPTRPRTGRPSSATATTSTDCSGRRRSTTWRCRSASRICARPRTNYPSQRAHLLLHPSDRLPRLRRDGPVRRVAGRGHDRDLAVGSLSRRGGQAHGDQGKGLVVAPDLPGRADPACQGLGAVPELDPRQDRGTQLRLPGGDPARPAGDGLRGLRREHLRGPRGADPDPAHSASILDGINRRSVIQIAQDLGYTVAERDIGRSELYLADEVFLTGTAAELVPVREIDDHPIAAPGEITSVIASKFDDALHGRAPEYAEWLDPVDEPSKVVS